MTNQEYKNLQRQGLDYAALNTTLKKLEETGEVRLQGEIRRILNENAIEKPKSHNQANALNSTHYKIDLYLADIEYIISLFFDLEASSVGEIGETTPDAAFYASLVDRWSDFRDKVE